jgi:hypothetical protein
MATTLTKAFADVIATSFENLDVALVRQDRTECSGGGYQRVKFGETQTKEDDNYIYISNKSKITFCFATSDIAPANNKVSTIQLYNSSNLVVTMGLTEAKPYLNQDQFTIPPDSLVLRILKINNG